MKKPEENVIRTREKGGGATFGINSWKFNQGGFKDGVCVCVRAGVCCCFRKAGL